MCGKIVDCLWITFEIIKYLKNKEINGIRRKLNAN